MKLITIHIAFLSIYYSKLTGVGKINPTIIKPKIPTNIPALANLGEVIANNGGSQVVANSVNSNPGIEGMPISVISGGSVIGFGSGKIKTTTKSPNSVEVVGKKDLEEKLANTIKAEVDGVIEKLGSDSDLNNTNEKDLEGKSDKENKIGASVENEKPLSNSESGVTKDSGSSSSQSVDSEKDSSSKRGVAGVIGGVGSALYNVGSAAIGVASSVVETAASTVVVPIVSPIVSPVVNIVSGSRNDQPKIENTKPVSNLDSVKDADSLKLESADKKEASGSGWRIGKLFNSIGSAAVNIASAPVNAVTSLVT
jgi:hypothetical protein